MKAILLCLTIALLLALLRTSSPASESEANTGCEHLLRQTNTAIKARDVGELQSIARQAADACQAPEVAIVRTATANQMMVRLYQNADLEDNPAKYETELLEVQRYGSLWRINALLGDIYDKRQDFAKAAERFQVAIDDIDSFNSNVLPDKRVSPDVREVVFRKAELSRLAADRYVAVPRNRNGAPTGLAAVLDRGVGKRTVAMPIFFEFDSTEFTPQGRKAAEDLADLLAHDQSQGIKLVGHTDAIGEPDYNLSLSKRRAQALADWLRRDKQITREIMVEGRGDSEPLELDNPDRYTTDQTNQMNRRVQLVLPREN